MLFVTKEHKEHKEGDENALCSLCSLVADKMLWAGRHGAGRTDGTTVKCDYRRAPAFRPQFSPGLSRANECRRAHVH